MVSENKSIEKKSVVKEQKKEDVVSVPKEEKLNLQPIHDMAEELLQDIVVSQTSVPGLSANIFLSKFSDYDKGVPKDRSFILNKITEKYRYVDMNTLEKIQDFPLALIALYILEKKVESVN